MAETFESLYASDLKAVFTEQAREQLTRGAEAFASAQAYAELGKPDFTLAFLLLTERADEEKREMLAYAYERRATLEETKAQEFSQQFHRPFPLIKLEARRDLQAALAVREKRPIPPRS